MSSVFQQTETDLADPEVVSDVCEVASTEKTEESVEDADDMGEEYCG